MTGLGGSTPTAAEMGAEGREREVARLKSPEIDRVRALARRCTTPMATGGEIVWHVWGEARAGEPPLVLLHGGSGSWTHWVRNIESLAATGRRVWLPDLPGFGDSAAPDGSDADALVAPMAEGLRTLFGEQTVDLVGFSFGGLTAGLTLAAHPALARQVVLVGAPGLGVGPEQPVRLKGWRHLPPQQQLDVHRYNLGALMLCDARLIEGLALQVHTANVVRDRLPRRRLASTDILRRTLPAVRCPVHVIYGEADALYQGQIGSLEGVYRAATPDFRGLQLVAGAGHWVQFEAPAAFQDALLAALRDGARPLTDVGSVPRTEPSRAQGAAG